MLWFPNGLLVCPVSCCYSIWLVCVPNNVYKCVKLEKKCRSIEVVTRTPRLHITPVITQTGPKYTDLNISLHQGSVDVPSLPVAVLEEIFQNLPAEQVVCVCRLVCREWRDVVDCACLWKERCRREGLRPSDPVKTPSDWRLFYILCKKRRNLLKNPKAEGEESIW